VDVYEGKEGVTFHPLIRWYWIQI